MKARIKVITFESWVTTDRAFAYAIEHARNVPSFLVDRSPCADPFFDPLEAAIGRRICTVSGLCRGFTPKLGDEILYMTRLGRQAATAVSKMRQCSLLSHLAVAHLRVIKVFDSHEAASTKIKPKAFVSRGRLTSRPPNVIGPNQVAVAVPPKSSLIRLDGGEFYTPDQPQHAEHYHENVNRYVERSQGHDFKRERRPLKMAVCEALHMCLDWKAAPIFDPRSLSGKMNVNGRWEDRQTILQSLGWGD